LTAEEVDASLGHDVDLILDTGPCPGNRPSTLLSVVGEPTILRTGPVSAKEIQRVLSKIGLLVPVKGLP
jgi:L-threonylcarbamoyladenylate synthase